MGRAQSNNEKPNLASVIKEIRSELGISQEDFARNLNVSFATVNRWENEKTTPSRLAMSQIDAFCKKRNIKNVDWAAFCA